jgi:hypothetical protein
MKLNFTAKRTNCSPSIINNIQIPVQTVVKYLDLYLDQKLTWQKHIKTKCQQLNLKVRQISWLLGRKSKLSLENKSLIYKCILTQSERMEFNYGDVLNHQTPK